MLNCFLARRTDRGRKQVK